MQPLLLAPLNQVSIHAPARGATAEQFPKIHIFSQFQSTRPRGARRFRILSFSAVTAVSIHAPARGATSRRAHGASKSRCFNPRARAGRDAICVVRKRRRIMFQSTRPRGARHSSLLYRWVPSLVSIHAPARGATLTAPGFCCIHGGFNPRARAGRDLS